MAYAKCVNLQKIAIFLGFQQEFCLMGSLVRIFSFSGKAVNICSTDLAQQVLDSLKSEQKDPIPRLFIYPHQLLNIKLPFLQIHPSHL